MKNKTMSTPHERFLSHYGKVDGAMALFSAIVDLDIAGQPLTVETISAAHDKLWEKWKREHEADELSDEITSSEPIEKAQSKGVQRL